MIQALWKESNIFLNVSGIPMSVMQFLAFDFYTPCQNSPSAVSSVSLLVKWVMISYFLSDLITKSSITDEVVKLYNLVLAFISDCVTCATEYFSLSQTPDNAPLSLYFTPLQLVLLKGFVLILFLNLLLIIVSWRVYGKSICDRFMKPGWYWQCYK